MVLTRIESTRYDINCSFGEIIDKCQDCNNKKLTKNPQNNKRTLERKKKKTSKTTKFDFI